ncbi:hypothetical protein RhiirB3_453509 [Rhizophagus irregularis]|nr:hypothetical protein RhiirB3_453509 [Rhizophagus irregularis]
MDLDSKTILSLVQLNLRCINGDIISNEHVRRKNIFQSIDIRKFTIWQYKQYILWKEAKINCLCLELFSQFTSHLEKNKLVLILYNYDTHTILYKAYYAQTNATIAENTMLSAPKFEPACIINARQKMSLPISHHVLNQKSEALNGPISPPLL